MHLLNLIRALIQHSVHRRGDRERTPDDGAETDKEAGERLGALLAVDDFHGGDILFTRVSQLLHTQKRKGILT